MFVSSWNQEIQKKCKYFIAHTFLNSLYNKTLHVH